MAKKTTSANSHTHPLWRERGDFSSASIVNHTAEKLPTTAGYYMCPGFLSRTDGVGMHLPTGHEYIQKRPMSSELVSFMCCSIS